MLAKLLKRIELGKDIFINFVIGNQKRTAMIIISDCGGTKGDWTIICDLGRVCHVQTEDKPHSSE